MRLYPPARPWLLTIATSVAALFPAVDAMAQAAPAPATSSDPAPPAAPIIRPYAWIKPTVVVSGSPVESFGQPNATAVTAAGNPVLNTIDEAGWTFQVAQSRLGFWFAEKSPVRGQFELDFIDFTKSSPTVQALPRLRIAKVEWALSDTTTLMAGQDWDLFQPVNPYTVDIVAVAFQAGNTAFMRQQAKLIWKNDSLEVGAAIGLAGINATARASIPEYNFPSFAARAALVLGATGRIGISAIGTSWRFAPDTPTERKAFAGAVGLYGDVTPAERFNLRYEAYVGRNLANMGALSLGQGNATENGDLDEVGGFLSAKYGFTDAHALYGLVGLAQILNDEDVVPSYSIPMGGGAATVAGTGPGMKSNLTARLGYEYRFDKTVAVMAEGFFFKSEHVLAATEAATIDGDVTAVGGELGLFFTL
jgi:hypothetical protein